MNRVFVTFDYELFLGSHTGSVERSILAPTRRLIELANAKAVRFTFFVDVGFLVALKKAMHLFERLASEYSQIASQLQDLKGQGHSIQLHVHPQWEDAQFRDGAWIADVSRYRLQQFSQGEIERIVASYKAALVEIVGEGVYAFRAGGSCLQPFGPLRAALKANGIWLDSSIYRDGYMNTPTHQFDYRSMPDLPDWRFEEDPLVVEPNGYFKEVPISPMRYSRFFYLKMAAHRLLGTQRHRMMGDGRAVGSGRSEIMRQMLLGGNGVASLDSFRASCLVPAYKAMIKRGLDNHFVILGHPKALAESSLQHLGRLCDAYGPQFAVL